MNEHTNVTLVRVQKTIKELFFFNENRWRIQPERDVFFFKK